MIKKIKIFNFRSIVEQELTIKGLNIIYGPNGSGKSSAMYAPYVFRNFFVNPNQRLNNLFNLGFINLGGFKDIILSHDESRPISIDIESDFLSTSDSFQDKLNSSKVLYTLQLYDN